MSRSLLLILLAVGLLALLLAAFDLLPFGLGGGQGTGEGGRAGTLLTEDSTEEMPTLEGLGSAGKPAADERTALASDAPSVPSSVAGGTPGGGVVRGRVVRATGGVPVAGVTVTLTRPDSLIAYLRASANGRFDTLEARTGEDGRFTFRDVTPSQGYALRAFHEAYAATSHGERIDLRGRGTLDVGDLVLGPGARVRGRVVDEAGAPVEGARIAVTWNIQNPLSVVLVHPDTAPELEKEATSDADGRFLIERLEPGPKTIFAEVEGGGADVKTRINLKEGQTRELKDLVIPSDRFLAGVVRWKSGGPIAGARVFGAPWQESAMRATQADAQGRWRLSYLPEGERYAIGVLVAGLPVEYKDGFDLNDEEIVIEFDDPGSLVGVVVDGQTKAPVERFSVQLDSATPSMDPRRRFVEQQVKAGLGPAPFQDEGGRFRFPRVAAGTWTVNVHAPGFPIVRKADVVVVAGETSEVRIELPAGNRATGRVERSTGDPVPQARLYLLPAGSVQETGRRILSLKGLTADREPASATRGDGSFELPPQTPGRYDLVAEVEGELPGVLRGIDLRDGDVSGLTVRLAPSGAVQGRILDETGAPASGEEIYVLFPGGAVRTFHADDDGRFEADGLPVGRCLVRWVSLNDTRDYFAYVRNREEGETQAGYDKLRQKGEEHVISDGQVTRVVLRLPPRTKVSGRLRIAGGEPPEKKRRFYVTVAGGGRWIDVECDARGEFSFRIPPGTYVSYAPGSTDEWHTSEFTVPDTATHTWDLDTE